jgi:FkbM family methyltransferase
MKKILVKILRTLSLSEIVYKASQKIIDYHDNLNNCELETNGELSFLQSIVPEANVVFDVGANVGDWTELVTGLNGQAKVYSFEPVKATYDTLCTKKFGSNVVCENLGLGDAVGEVDFFVYPEDSTLNTLHQRQLASSSQAVVQKIQISTVDIFCEANNISSIDLLKIDTEGHEFSVLKGAKYMLQSGAIKAIQFEYGGAYIDSRTYLKDIYEFLAAKGYEVYKVMPHHLLPISKYAYDLEDFKYANYVARLK